MSTPEIFAKIQRAFLKPSNIRRHVSQGNSKGRIRDIKRPKISERAPTIFDWTKATVVWRSSKKFSHKSKHRQQPHTRNWRMPVTILGGEEGRAAPIMPYTYMKLKVSDIKDIEKAGGLEAKMISTAAKNFSVNGKLLRGALFNELHRMHDAMLREREVLELDPQGESKQLVTMEKGTAQIGNKKQGVTDFLSSPRVRKFLGIEAPKPSDKSSTA